jgi:hypothetical protein
MVGHFQNLDPDTDEGKIEDKKHYISHVEAGYDAPEYLG